MKIRTILEGSAGKSSILPRNTGNTRSSRSKVGSVDSVSSFCCKSSAIGSLVAMVSLCDVTTFERATEHLRLEFTLMPGIDFISDSSSLWRSCLAPEGSNVEFRRDLTDLSCSDDDIEVTDIFLGLCGTPTFDPLLVTVADAVVTEGVGLEGATVVKGVGLETAVVLAGAGFETAAVVTSVGLEAKAVVTGVGFEAAGCTTRFVVFIGAGNTVVF